ncbi:MAG TPA: DUF2339 domain-containing protein [Gemmataceae bacterium]|jgi:uncharacterized membrane protein
MLDVIVPLIFLSGVAGIIVLIFFAVRRSQELTRLENRLEILERAVARLRRSREPPTVAEEAPPPVVSAETSVAPAEVLEAIPAEAARPQPRPALPIHEPDADTLESWIGRQGFGWAAVVLLLFATAFFLKYAFENRWIGELGRVALGVLGGVALCLAGLRYHRKGWRAFSQMLTAGGVVLLYLATFGAFGYYHLLPRRPAGFFLVLLVVETGALAVRYEAPAIAVMAVIGALLNPLLLHTGRDEHAVLFPYLLVLDGGVVALTLFRHWRGLATLALLGTQGLFWGWHAEHYHPEKLAPALAVQLGIFALFLAHHLLVPVLRSRRVDVEELVRVPLNALFLIVAGYTLLDEDYHRWLGSLSLAMAAVYAALGWLLLRRHGDDAWHVLVVVAVSLAFVAMVFPLEADAAWIGLGWAVEGLALWWFGLRVRVNALRVLGVVLLVLAAGRLVFVDTPWGGREPFVPIFNKYTVPALLIAGCVAGAAIAARRFLSRLDDFDRLVRVVAALGGVLLVWMILSLDTYQFFTARLREEGMDVEHLQKTANTSLSVLWAAYAAFVLALGFRRKVRQLRWTALGLFGLTLAKVFLVDMAGLPGLYRVAAFFVLSVMMGAAAWGYQKLERLHRPERREEVSHETG